MAFYGAIEQVLTGWIFGFLPEGEAEFEQAKAFVVETICGGLEAPAADRDLIRIPRRRWTTISSSASSGPASSPASARWPAWSRPALAAVVYRRIFGEDPPE